MLTRLQLLLLTIMATLGGSFAGFLAVGIAMGDITLAMINLGVIVALFCCAFVIGGGSGESSVKKTAIDHTIKQKYVYADTGEEFELNEDIFSKDMDWSYNLSSRRAGDIHVGGELNPEFKN